MLSRLLVVHSSSELYGSDRALLETVRALRSQGCEVVVALPETGPLEAALRQSGADVRVVPTVVLRKADLSGLGLVRVAWTALRVLRSNVRLLRSSAAQLLYVNTLNIPMWLPLARWTALPAVCHVHEAEEGLARPVALALAMPLLLAQHVVVNSEAALDLLLRTCPALTGRTTVVYNGVPGPPGEAADVPARPGVPARLVLVGRLAPRKGTDVAVSAAAELHRRGVPVRLELVGSGAPGLEDYEREVRQQVAASGLGKHVSFHGFLDDVWGRLAKADVVLVPSRIEPFGNVAVEAALARRPVVVSAVQGLREIVSDGNTGRVVPPGDAVALADAVQSVLDDWPAARDMAARAEEDARRRFGVQRYGDELLAVLAGALRRPPHAGRSRLRS